MWTKDKVKESGYYWVWDGVSKSGFIRFIVKDSDIYKDDFEGWYWDKLLQCPSIDLKLK
jgi:hypothetical protein